MINEYGLHNKVDATQMIVTWVTFDSTEDSVVEYGSIPTDLYSVEQGSSDQFQDGGTEKRILYIHRVLLKSLIPGQTYC